MVKKQKTELAKLQATSQQQVSYIYHSILYVAWQLFVDQESKLSEQSKEVARLNEEVSSVNMKVRWGQNKLKAETDAHKVGTITPEYQGNAVLRTGVGAGNKGAVDRYYQEVEPGTGGRRTDSVGSQDYDYSVPGESPPHTVWWW